MINIRKIEDVRYNPNHGLIIDSVDFRGKKESHNLLDLDQQTIYNIINQIYELGKEDKKTEIWRAINL